jgi:hypothetical protein
MVVTAAEGTKSVMPGEPVPASVVTAMKGVPTSNWGALSTTFERRDNEASPTESDSQPWAVWSRTGQLRDGAGEVEIRLLVHPTGHSIGEIRFRHAPAFEQCPRYFGEGLTNTVRDALAWLSVLR